MAYCGSVEERGVLPWEGRGKEAVIGLLSLRHLKTARYKSLLDCSL